MAEIAIDIVDQWRRGELLSTPQQVGAATFSIWRDDADYEIDSSNSAAEIERFVNAVGHPYAGARTKVGGVETVRVRDVTVLPDKPFEIRQAGKIWSLDNGRPIVISADGILSINNCPTDTGPEFLS